MIFKRISNKIAVKLFLIIYLCISQFAYLGSLYSNTDECKEQNNNLEIEKSTDTSTEPFLVKIDESKSISNNNLFSKQQNFLIAAITIQTNLVLPFSYSDDFKFESLILFNRTNPRSPPITIS